MFELTDRHTDRHTDRQTQMHYHRTPLRKGNNKISGSSRGVVSRLELMIGVMKRGDLSHLTIGLYSKNAIAIESEAKDPFGGNVYYVTMQITLHIPEFAHKERERNLHCDVCVYYTLPPNGSFASLWITRSQQSRRHDKGL